MNAPAHSTYCPLCDSEGHRASMCLADWADADDVEVVGPLPEIVDRPFDPIVDGAWEDEANRAADRYEAHLARMAP